MKTLLALLLIMTLSGCRSTEKKVICTMDEQTVTVQSEKDTIQKISLDGSVEVPAEELATLETIAQNIKDGFAEINGITYDYTIKDEKYSTSLVLEFAKLDEAAMTTLGISMDSFETDHEIYLTSLKEQGFNCK